MPPFQLSFSEADLMDPRTALFHASLKLTQESMRLRQNAVGRNINTGKVRGKVVSFRGTTLTVRDESGGSHNVTYHPKYFKAP